MSAKATFWAWDQSVPTVHHRCVLLCLANCHNSTTKLCNPSISYIASKTGSNRKTVMKAIGILADIGLISSQKKRGFSNKYVLNITSVDIEPADQVVQPGVMEGIAAEVLSSSGFTHERDASSPDIGNQVVPAKGYKPKKESKTKLKDIFSEYDFGSFPELPSEEVWIDYLAMRKQKKALVSQTVVSNIGRTLSELNDLGYRTDDVLGEAITRNWTGLKADWIHKEVGRGMGAVVATYARKQSLVERVSEQARRAIEGLPNEE